MLVLITCLPLTTLQVRPLVKKAYVNLVLKKSIEQSELLVFQSVINPMIG